MHDRRHRKPLLAWGSGTSSPIAAFDAVGKKGSIATVERFILSLKREFLWKIFVPSSLRGMERAVAAYRLWYNEHRPHSALDGATPNEVQRAGAVVPARSRPRLEPRPRMPLARGDPRAKRCAELDLVVSYVDDRKELPVVELREVA